MTYRMYEAADHLLQVQSTGFNESYRRFYYRDIQAILVQRTALWHILSGLLGAPTLLILIPTASAFLANLTSGAGALSEGVVVAGAFAFAGGVLLAVNLALGPTCRCFLKTAVQTERLVAVGRVRAARRFIARIRPRIVEAQGLSHPDSPAAAAGATPVPEETAPPGQPTT